MRVTDAVNGFPSILLTLVIISILGSGRQNVILSLGIVFVPSYVRIVRGEFIRLRDADYISRARAYQGARCRYPCASESMLPRLASGACTPMPR